MEYTSGIGTCQWLIRVILVSPYLIMDNPHYIVVEGPSGVGKTALAQKLSKTFESRLLLETAFDNPFLGRFYQDRRQYALQTQLAFLIGRIQQLEKLNQDDMFHSSWVSNFFLERDLLFAEFALSTDEFEIYRHLYNKLAPKIVSPSLVIFLQAPVSLLRSRLLNSGVPDEHTIPLDYLTELVESYSRFFLRYKKSPVLMINTEHIDFINNDYDYNALLEYLPTVKNGKYFFNPIGSFERIG